MAKSNGNEAEAVARYLERIEGLEAEKKQTADKIKTLYDAAEADGMNKAALKLIVKERKADVLETAKMRVAADKMRKLLAGDTGLAGTELGEWAIAQAAAMTSARNSRPPKATQPEVKTVQ